MHNIQLIGRRKIQKLPLKRREYRNADFLWLLFLGTGVFLFAWSRSSLTHFLDENSVTVPSILSTIYRSRPDGISSVKFLWESNSTNITLFAENIMKMIYGQIVSWHSCEYAWKREKGILESKGITHIKQWALKSRAFRKIFEPKLHIKYTSTMRQMVHLPKWLNMGLISSK